jgi:transposase
MDNKQGVFGVDVCKATLTIVDYETQAVTEIGNAPEPISAWLARVPAGSAVAMEATGVYHRVLAHSAHAAGLVIYVLNPQVLKHYAQAIGQRGKTDGADARMIARYLVHERSKLRPWQPPVAAVDTLSQLLVRRHKLISARQTLAQSLSGMPMLKAPRQALLASFKRMIATLELLIARELARLPEMAALHRRLMSIVGIGKIVAAQLVAALRTLCFTRAAAFIAYTGLDPRPDDSGAHRGRRRLSKGGPALLRCLLYNAAMSAANSKVFKPLYARLRARGLQSTEAIVVLARKLARIAFALYKSGATFDAQKHLNTV